MKVKVQVGEWMAVYHTVVGWVDMPDEVPVIEANAIFYIDENGVDIENEDVDWSTVTHEEWDAESLEILDQQPDIENQKDEK